MNDLDVRKEEENVGQHDDLRVHPERKEAETDELEKLYQHDSASDPGEIPYTDEGDRPKGFRKFVTKRKTAGGLVIGMLLGGSLGLATVTSGPLQFIHLGQLLQRFHFQSVEDTGNGRMLKLYKFAKNKKAGTVEKTRLGVLGNKIADRIDTRFAKIGLEKKFNQTGALGKYEGMVLDPVKFSENAESGREFRRLGEEDFMNKFKEKYNVTITPNGDGSFTIPPDSSFFAYFKNKNLNLAMSEESGLNAITGSLATRVFGKRDNITWHPIKQADAYIVGSVDQKFSAWLREQKDRIKGGSGDETLTATGDPVTDENGKPLDPAQAVDNASAADTTTQAAADAKKSLGADGNPLSSAESAGLIKQLTESTGGKVALTGTAVVGLACAVQGISAAALRLKHDMVILPLIRIGMEAISLGNQVMAGNDMSLEQLGYFSKQLYSPQSGSWASAKSIQAELGEEQTGPDIPDEASISKIDNKSIFAAILGIPGLATVCKAADSTVGRAFTFAVSLTTPIATIATTAVTATPAFKDALGGLIKWLAGSPIPTMFFGPNYGSAANYGARFGSNHAAASMGGVKLTGTQTLELRDFENQALQQEIDHRSFAERMFDVYSPDSLASKVIDRTSGSVSNNVASLISTASNPLRAFSVFKTPFMSKVSAAVPYDYGFAKMGFSLDSLNSDTFEDPYANADAVPAILAGSNGKTYIDRAYKCFGVRLSADGSLKSDMNAQIDPNSQEYDSYGCADGATDWARVKFYILDTKTAEASVCYDYADTEACQASGFGQTSSAGNDINVAVPGDGFRGVDTSSQTCPSSSTDLGVKQVPTGDNLPPSVVKNNIRLCGIPEIPGGMNVAIVGNVISLIAAAKSAGVPLAGSSFRTTDTQIDLRKKHCGTSDYAVYQAPPNSCTPATAIPGTSMHEQGLAIDFDNCDGHSTACFQWLSSNAANYGLKNLPEESWHWSTTGN